MNRRALYILWCLALLLCCSGGGRAGEVMPAPDNGEGAVLYYFWGTGCPHCEEAKPFVKALQKDYPALRVESRDVMADRDNLRIWTETAARFGTAPAGVPAFYVAGQSIVGFSPEIQNRLITLLDKHFGLAVSAPSPEVVRLPLFGDVEPSHLSLPVFTLVIAGLDSFNPCAFFVLLFLLSLLVHAHSRKRMLLVGGTFVLCSGLVYFLFMAAWLNLFLLVGQLEYMTDLAGLVALVIGAINAKDYFFFKEGVSLSIPEAAKPRLFARMRGLLHSESTTTLLLGTVVLALAANSYELLCTAGFPMVYTRVLTLNQLSSQAYYLYLGLYNLVYVIPLAVIVGVFTWTLGSRKLTENQGRILKLLAGVMMLMLGAVLVFKPALLNDARSSALLLGTSLLLTGGIVLVFRARGRVRGD